MFHRNFVTDQYPQEIAEMCIREKMLEYLPDEIPYSYLMVLFRTSFTVDEIIFFRLMNDGN
jgi:GTPase Era involved in 16S rRNA processing